MAKVIVISGPPAAGKTSLAQYLSEKLGIPVLAKDFLKESLLDSLGYSDRKRSVEVGYAAFQLHLQLASVLSESGVDFIFETAFYRQSTGDIKNALAASDVIQAWLCADIDTMLSRAKTRPRHPGHADDYEGYEWECRDKLANGIYDALDIGGLLVELDTNDFESEQYSTAVKALVDAYRAI